VRARVEVEHQRERVVPLPPLREQRLEVLVADRVLRQPDVGQLEEDLVGHVARVLEVRDGRQQHIRLGGGDDQERAAVVSRATGPALAPDERQQQHARADEPADGPGGRSHRA